MIIKIAFINILFFALTSSIVNADNKFNWNLFLPSITLHHECSNEYIKLCKNKDNCKNADGYWYKKECHYGMTKSLYDMQRLAGYVHFTYTMYGIEWNEYYYFDINTLHEEPVDSGYFEIKGFDLYGNVVDVYSTMVGDYMFWNHGFSNYNEFFWLAWNDYPELTGNFYLVQKGHGLDDGEHTYIEGIYNAYEYK